MRLYWILAIVDTGYSGYTGYRGDYNGITIGLHFQLSPGLMWQSGQDISLVCRAVFRSDMEAMVEDIGRYLAALSHSKYYKITYVWFCQ